MKNILFALFFILSSCGKVEFFKYKNEELLDLKSLLKHDDFKYKALGTHLYQNDTVIATYMIDDIYELRVIKIDSVDKNYKIEVKGDKAFEEVYSPYTILDGGNYELKYNLAELSKIKKKNTLHFSSDGVIDTLLSNDSLQVYSTKHKYLTLYFNNKPNIRMYLYEMNLKNSKLRSDVVFYKKDDDIYFMILSSIDDNIAKGTILKYLN